MPVKINVESNIDTKDLQAAIDTLIKKVDDFVDSQQQALTATKEAAKASEEAAKQATQGTKLLAKGFKGVGLAIKAAGIFIIMEALRMLKQIFMQNQEVADAFAVAMEFVSRIFNDLVNFIVDNISVFTDIFTNPKKAMQDFADFIQGQITNRVNAAIDMFKLLGDVVKKVFQRDWSGAMESAGKAAAKFVDVQTGVEDTLIKLNKGVDDLVKGTIDYVRETGRAAKSTIDLANALITLNVEVANRIAQLDREIGLQNKIIANEKETFSQRRKAFQELKRLRNERADELVMIAEKELELANLQLKKDEDNRQYQAQALQATEKLRAANFEKKMADIETEEAYQTQAEAEQIERIDTELKRLEDKAEREVEIEDEKQKKMLEIQRDALNQMAMWRMEQASEEKKALEREKYIADTKESLYKNLFTALGLAAEQNFGFQKFVAAAEASINTFAAVAGALRGFSTNPTPGLAIAQALAIGAVGALQVRKILNTDINAPQVNLNSGTTAAPVAQVEPEPFNPQLPETTGEFNFGGRDAPPVKVYVVATDINDEQALIESINDRARI